MNWFGSGFCPIIIYGAFSEAILEDDALITENNFDILTENAQNILV